jgi:hypothetical protein
MPEVTTQHARTASREQDAVRLLFLLDRASDPPPDGSPEGAVGVVTGQARLQAMDFWMRSPDYLANELLTEYERTGDDALLAEARAILESDEPDVRRWPMVRFFFGAYEPLDDSLSVLRAAGLIAIHRDGKPGKVRRSDYYLLRKGREAATAITEQIPELAWYAGRAGLVRSVAGGHGGRALKDRQYLQQEYADTPLRDFIAPITDRVRERLRRLQP